MVGKGIDGLTYLDKMELPQAGDVPAPVEEPSKPAPSNEAQRPAGPQETGTSETQSAGVDQSGTSLKKSATESSRQKRGLEHPQKVLRRESRESHSLYRQREAQNPDYGRRIADSLSRGAPQALDDVEHSALLDQVIQAEEEASRPHSVPACLARRKRDCSSDA